MHRTITIPVVSAHSFLARARGLLWTRRWPLGFALWIKPCSQVHTLGMRYPIDVAFLDEDHRVLAIERLRPWRLSSKVGAASSVLEFCEGELQRLEITPGCALCLIEESANVNQISQEGVISEK